MNYPLLDKIKNPSDLQQLTLSDLINLSNEVRARIIEVLSVNGGHLSSNLGIVELTVALHKVFSSPYDKFIFDTSHQTYTHKLLTNRHKDFHTLRQIRGISGFSHPKESKHDQFFSGHAGAAFSQALGVAKCRDLDNEAYHVLPVIGDGSLTCGLTLEAFNNIPKNLSRFIVILNDNKMAISTSVGNIKSILSRLINSPTSNKIYTEIQDKLSKIPALGNSLANQGQKVKESIKNLFSPASFFEQFGLSYVGPLDGHDIKKLIDVLTALKDVEHPVIVHVLTTKGKGLLAAKENPTSYHGVKPFNAENGQFLVTNKNPTFPEIFGRHILKMAEKDPKITVLSPAMLAGSHLEAFKEKFPSRCFDSGIAEGHCVTFAGGLSFSKKNKIVVCIYSTFLQRAFDNIFHDVCLQNFPVVFAIDRAGISGPDGASHHGIYDIGFLNSLPNMVIAQSRNGQVLKELLESAFSYKRPIAIRYPNLSTEDLEPLRVRKLGEGEILLKGKDLLIIALGHHYKTAFEVRSILEKKNISPTIVDPIFLKPLDSDLFFDLLSTHSHVVTIEEHSVASGLGAIFNSFVVKHGFTNKVLNFGIGDNFVEHGKNQDLLKDLGLDANNIASQILMHFELNQMAKV